ncbi:AAA family ATPase [Sphingomonas sp. HMP6]|uniref:AAA family ATPase n=1 Tax=Sphingomonas sp. HMP6 TaxID=1517551 RepID=UPI001596909C|nr:AAA family ATPase [Sphingomonas sp. HMP6]BCA58123.1 hypothetical protein HMP06_0892 [Sphingomonas sp. HMP6]
MTTYKKPKRTTGLAKPDPSDLFAQARAEFAEDIVNNMWVDTARQRAILNKVRRYMRNAAKKRRGTPLGGRRLSQFSQAGKSAIAERLIAELEEEAIAAGREPNKHRVVHITISSRMTLKMLFMAILNRLADDFLDEPGSRALAIGKKGADDIRGKSNDNVMVLEQRIEEWVRRLGVELIVIDEVQILVTKRDRNLADLDYGRAYLTEDAFEVTKKLQSFIDRGVVPMLFIGDETSEDFFKLNGQFAARLGDPLKLLPLDVSKSADRQQFMKFCADYDEEVVKRGAVPIPTCLDQPAVLTGLIKASGGHIGRAARIIQQALPAAVERGAATMEAYDLSNAVRDYAMDLGWVDHDPFSVVPASPAAPAPAVPPGTGEPDSLADGPKGSLPVAEPEPVGAA